MSQTHMQRALYLAIILGDVQPLAAGEVVQCATREVSDYHQVQVPARLVSLVVMACIKQHIAVTVTMKGGDPKEKAAPVWY